MDGDGPAQFQALTEEFMWALFQDSSMLTQGRVEASRARAEASFKKEERARERAKARMEYEAEVRATQEKTTRLRPFRPAKEAADKVASPPRGRAKSLAR
jgi:hypothetical protein